MQATRRAAIDVGTNSVKLLVADVSGNEVRPVWEGSKQTRLGRGFYANRRLQPEPIAKTARAVARFAMLARAYNVERLRVIATSAVREAANANELVQAIESAANVEIEVITGDVEAELAFQGVTTDPSLSTAPLLLLDVGGGSTEVIVGREKQIRFRQSFPVGTVRLLEQFPHNDPPEAKILAECREWLSNFLRGEIRPRVGDVLDGFRDEGARNERVGLVGCGGTASVLARVDAGLEDYDRERIDATRLSLEKLAGHANHFWRIPLEERRAIPGMPPKRADVILTGVLIYESFMRELGFRELRITSRGLRFAAVL